MDPDDNSNGTSPDQKLAKGGLDTLRPGQLSELDQRESVDASIKQQNPFTQTKSSKPRIRHHEDLRLLVDVMLGKITTYTYPQNDFSQQWYSGVAMMRLIDLQPGQSTDRLECNLRTVRIDEGSPYDSLCFAWRSQRRQQAGLRESDVSHLYTSSLYPDRYRPQQEDLPERFRTR